jgi:cysteine synthase
MTVQTNDKVKSALELVRGFDPEAGELFRSYDLPSMEPWDAYGITPVALVAFQRIAHIKMIPAYAMLMSAYLGGKLEGVHTIVVDSSGNTAHGIARIAPLLGFKVHVILSTDVPPAKKAILESLSTVQVTAVPGGVAAYARAQAALEGHYHLNQYADPENLESHFKFTGPEVLRGVGRPPLLVSIAMGTGGTAGGVAKFFHSEVQADVRVIGARPTLGEDVPGSRDAKRMRESSIPWNEHIAADRIVEVSRKDSFVAMRKLWQVLQPQVGPTSGLAYEALVRYFLARSEEERELMRGREVVFLCPDDGRFYTEYTAGELRPEEGLLPSRK